MLVKDIAKMIIKSINPGKADISGIGDGTIKGAIRELNKNLEERTNKKVKIYGDAEGGNIRIFAPDGRPSKYWEIDAYNGNLRFYGESSGGRLHTVSIPSGKNGTLATVEEVNSAASNVESKLPFRHTAKDTSGAAFGYDFLHVDIKNKFGSANQSSFFWLGNNHGSWINIPPGLDEYATGIREVFWADAGNILVKVTETTKQNLGKTYYNYYTNNGTGLTWSGWVQKG